MKTMIQKIEESSKYLKKQGIENGAIGIILGTGLSDLVNHLEIEKEIPFEDIPNFRSATVEHHTGKLIYGYFKFKESSRLSGSLSPL